MAINPALLAALQGGIAQRERKNYRRAETLAALASLGGAAAGGVAGGFAGGEFNPTGMATGLGVGQATGQTLGGLAAGSYGHSAALQGAQNIAPGFNPMLRDRAKKAEAMSLADLAQGRFVGQRGDEIAAEDFATPAARQGYFEGRTGVGIGRGPSGSVKLMSDGENQYIISPSGEIIRTIPKKLGPHQGTGYIGDAAEAGERGKQRVRQEYEPLIAGEKVAAETMARLETQEQDPSEIAKQESGLAADKRQAELAIQTVDDILERADKFGATGWGNFLLGWAPDSPGGDINARLRTLKSTIGLDRLLEIKKQGGTLGALSDTEMVLLVSAAGSLDPLQRESFLGSMNTIKRLLPKMYQEKAQRFEDVYGRQPRAGGFSVGGDSGEIKFRGFR